MRHLILTSILLLTSVASAADDWKRPYVPASRRTTTYEYTNGNYTYGTYIGGGYTIYQNGPVTIINTYTAPVFGSGIQPPTRIYSGPQPRSYYYPSN